MGEISLPLFFFLIVTYLIKAIEVPSFPKSTDLFWQFLSDTNFLQFSHGTYLDTKDN